MPYINKADRPLLDPFIDPIASYLLTNGYDKGPHDYLRIGQGILYELACQTLVLVHSDRRSSIVNAFPFDTFPFNNKKVRDQIFNLATAIHNLSQSPTYNGNFAGPLNYGATEILLLGMAEGLRYHKCADLETICWTVAAEFKDQIIITDPVSASIVTVIGYHVPREFYDRLVREYENGKILDPKAGDTRGYLRHIKQPR